MLSVSSYSEIMLGIFSAGLEMSYTKLMQRRKELEKPLKTDRPCQCMNVTGEARA